MTHLFNSKLARRKSSLACCLGILGVLMAGHWTPSATATAQVPARPSSAATLDWLRGQGLGLGSPYATRRFTAHFRSAGGQYCAHEVEGYAAVTQITVVDCWLRIVASGRDLSDKLDVTGHAEIDLAYASISAQPAVPFNNGEVLIRGVAGHMTSRMQMRYVGPDLDCDDTHHLRGGSLGLDIQLGDTYITSARVTGERIRVALANLQTYCPRPAQAPELF